MRMPWSKQPKVYTLALPDPEYWDSLRGVVGPNTCLFFKYHPVAVTFNGDAHKVQQLLGGKIFQEKSGAVFNEQALQFVVDNQDLLRDTLRVPIAVCDK